MKIPLDLEVEHLKLVWKMDEGYEKEADGCYCTITEERSKGDSFRK